MSKYTIEFCKKFALEKGGECISNEYINTSTKMNWECSCGRVISKTLNNVLDGAWCVKCKRLLKTDVKINECREIAKNKNGKCLSEKYINNKFPLKWECNLGHIWNASYTNIKKNTWCSICSGNKKHTIDTCIKLAHSKNGKCLSKVYVDAHTKMLWHCNICENQWYARFSDIKNEDTWCLKCSLEKKKNTISYYQDIAISRGGKCISETHIGAHIKMLWECKIGHQWWAKPSDITTSSSWCPKCCLGAPKAQQDIEKYIQELGFTTIFNDRSIIPPLELDIFIPSKNIAIEYCGLYWHSERYIKNNNQHLNKLKLCQEKNIKLITIFEDEWLLKEAQTKGYLKAILGKTENKIHARKCEIREVESNVAKEFHRVNHIQGFAGGVNIGLYFNEELVCVATFTKLLSSRQSAKQDIIELIRYTNKINFSIPGGFSKVIKHFIKNNEHVKQIISYSDNRWSEGNLYSKNEFVLYSTNKPTYWYFKSPILNRLHKSGFQKSRIIRLFSWAGIDNTEWDIMQANGYDRIWDCGNKKWILKIK